MLKEIELVNQQGETQTVNLNPNAVVFTATINLESNIKNLEGKEVFKEGTAIALSSGIVVNSELSIDEVNKLLED